MLNKIKTILLECKFAIIAIAVAVAYLMGQRKGKSDEKIRQNKKVLENISRADSARRSLDDPAVADRVRKKYTRK